MISQSSSSTTVLAAALSDYALDTLAIQVFSLPHWGEPILLVGVIGFLRSPRRCAGAWLRVCSCRLSKTALTYSGTHLDDINSSNTNVYIKLK